MDLRRLLPLIAVLASGCGPAVGSIRVFAPAGAQVFLDDHPQGEIGEGGLLLERVPVGAHRLRVEREGYEAQGVALMVARRQTVELGLGPLREGAQASKKPVGKQTLATETARGFYHRGKGDRALAVLGDADAVLRMRIEQALDLHRRASKLSDAGNHYAAGSLWDRLMVIEPDPKNWYHAEAKRRRR